MLRQLAGSSLNDDELQRIVARVMQGAADPQRGLTFPEYRAALEGAGGELHVDVPIED